MHKPIAFHGSHRQLCRFGDLIRRQADKKLQLHDLRFDGVDFLKLIQSSMQIQYIILNGIGRLEDSLSSAAWHLVRLA